MDLPSLSRFTGRIAKPERAVRFFAATIILIPALTLALFSLPTAAQTAINGTEETATEKLDPSVIKTFNLTMEFLADGSATLTEEITADFSLEPRHGIYRDIPIELSNQKLDLKLISITDEKERPWKYELTHKPDYLSLKIGNPDILIQNLATYRIKYEVKNSIIEAKAGQQIYWDVTGHGWEMPIKMAKVKIVLPALVGKDQLLLNCYTGAYGSTDKLCKLRLENDGSIQGQTVLPLNIFEGFSIKVDLPPHYFDLPEPQDIAAAEGPEQGADINQLIEINFFSFLWNFLLSLP